MSRKGLSTLETSFDSSSANLQAPEAVRERSAKGISLVLAGHHPLTLCGLSQVLEKEPDCTVLASSTDAEAVVDVVRRHQPDIVILDLDRKGAFRALRRIQRAHLAARVIILASASDDKEMIDAVRLGAHAVVLKELPPEAFVTCIRKVHGGERAIEEPGDGSAISKLFKSSASLRHMPRQLTPRETEIARLAVLGIPTRDIAARLDVKQGTVKIHLHSIYEKLNVGGRLGLILFARRHGLA
jgi:DNA-binding NarL/FixJ family response regulator